jgi:hypothetical protein
VDDSDTNLSAINGLPKYCSCAIDSIDAIGAIGCSH